MSTYDNDITPERAETVLSLLLGKKHVEATGNFLADHVVSILKATGDKGLDDHAIEMALADRAKAGATMPWMFKVAAPGSDHRRTLVREAIYTLCDENKVEAVPGSRNWRLKGVLDQMAEIPL